MLLCKIMLDLVSSCPVLIYGYLLDCHLMVDHALYEADWIVFVTAGGRDKLVIYQTGGQVRATEGGGEYAGYRESPPESKSSSRHQGTTRMASLLSSSFLCFIHLAIISV